MWCLMSDDGWFLMTGGIPNFGTIIKKTMGLASLFVPNFCFAFSPPYFVLVSFSSPSRRYLYLKRLDGMHIFYGSVRI